MSTSSLNLNDPFEPDPEEPSKIEPEREAEPAWWRALHSRLPKLGIHGRIPWEPLRRLSLLALLVLGAVLLWRGVEKSLRSIPPGWVGVSVNRLTGSVAVLDPGTFLRPSALFQIHPVRISDQLLSGDEGQFNVTTKEGVLARVSVQARWAISRKSLLATWSALPQRPGEELVAPVLFAAFRTAAPRYEVLKLIAEQREELSAVAAATARERLAESGIVLKEVLIGDLQLPEEFEKGRLAMVDEVQTTERLDVTLKKRAKQIEETRLTAEAQKARQIQEAEAAAEQKVIGVRAEADSMKHVLALKEKQIEQRKLEAEAERQSIVERAHAAADAAKIQAIGAAEATRIQTEAEAERRRTMADAEAYATRTSSLAEFEGLEREARLVTANPLLIPKTFADRLSDRVQVILTPSIGGEAFTGEFVKRAASGQSVVAEQAEPSQTAKVASRKKSKSESTSHTQ
jgi:regulator of protease activity HflC (stomatin/prohibitin superfamily)